MPPAIPYIVAGVKAVGAWWGAMSTAAKVAFVIKAAAVVGSVAYSVNQSKKLKNSLKNKGTTIAVREPAASRKIVYGKQRVGGTTIFMHTTGADNKWAHMVVIHADHECDGFEKVQLNDDIYTPDANGNVVSNEGYTYVKTHRGWDGEGAESELVNDSGGYWTSSDKVSGCAYSYMRLQYNADRFPSGAPSLSVVLRGKKVHDPRTDETAWSENPALCILDYLKDAQYGLGCDDDEIDTSSFIAAANACEETVHGLQRYTLNGVVDTADTPKAILEDMLTSCAGMLVNSGGVWRLIVGVDRPVSATFTLDQLRGPLSPQCGDSLRDTCNAVKGIYVSPLNQWQPADFIPAVSSVTADNITAGARVSIASVGTTNFTLIGADSNAVGHIFTATGPGTGSGTVDTFLGEDGGQRIWRDIELPFCIYQNEAHRHARIALRRARQDITIPLQLNLAGLAVTVGDIIRLPFARYGWDSGGGKLFEVTNWKLTWENSENGPLPGVDIVAREYAPTVWDDGIETTADEAPNTNLPDPYTVEDVSGLSVSSSGYIETDGAYVPRLTVAWSVADNEFILSGGSIEIEFRKSGTSTWLPWNKTRADAGTEYITDVKAGETYEVRARFWNVLGVRGAWSTDSAGVSGAGTPSAPTGLSLSTASADMMTVPRMPTTLAGVYYGAAVLKWTASTSKDVAYYEVWRTAGVPSMIARTAGTETFKAVYQAIQVNHLTDDLFVRTVSRSGLTSSDSAMLYGPHSFTTNYGPVE